MLSAIIKKKSFLWNVRYSGYLALKYLVTARKDCFTERLEMLLPTLICGLKDEYARDVFGWFLQNVVVSSVVFLLYAIVK